MDTGAILGRGVVTSIGKAGGGAVTFSEVVTYYNANKDTGIGCADIDNNSAGTAIGSGTTGSDLAC